VVRTGLSHRSALGFTLFEMMIVLVILAIPVVRFASTWGTSGAAPVVPSAHQR